VGVNIFILTVGQKKTCVNPRKSADKRKYPQITQIYAEKTCGQKKISADYTDLRRKKSAQYSPVKGHFVLIINKNMSTVLIFSRKIAQ
jgi:hypothetical protein